MVNIVGREWHDSCSDKSSTSKRRRIAEQTRSGVRWAPHRPRFDIRITDEDPLRGRGRERYRPGRSAFRLSGTIHSLQTQDVEFFFLVIFVKPSVSVLSVANFSK